MTIEQAIGKAIEGGYMPFKRGRLVFNKKTESWWHQWGDINEDGDKVTFENPTAWHSLQYFNKLLLDPSFWQSLGKAIGWGENQYSPGEGLVDGWLYYWHNFIDHLADGGTIESYFEKL